ncbi:uncharacterized protein DUF4288 [Anseongella ginsenosidimutans]|uniref:Uncharacterized protein DUF4288 n=1 Tax=Anseongella ginsenosidimutans TaxID=496056 RepID=A0A4R3KX21_9SPHI|nr:DUF4288 domain-containing protein [Anseongella ginsenosidimutans]QEC51679.1 DUF4288 domain-containing protein [Anseongella ginsenosidimutans]TCS89030.1 uncharacterized protein DUF4288 [Anseongella ginsenosidimutans]
MGWYISKIIFQVICGDGEHTPQFDEQLRLIQAGNEQEALKKAIEIGLEEQNTFNNSKDESVIWSFIDVAELQRVNELKDKTELYSRIVEPENEENYVGLIELRAERVRSNCERQSIDSLLGSSLSL